ncbi:DUF4097 family beta strand repeat-containing protein [Streptomyces sp. NRRL S-495]|uniref:DUF4097 family beta strand repeat-containing protein n=1 Tax=Streptomyces sp. NRRL S-495 TaxID=1609133 RepID=UPI0005F93792|nr:DUF4097 family beta strand repeat-containing protein [Streptomyces sp. NRRL S-495]KJY26130.1 hypothetical protein VR45_37715 [Streptomyces sp. NRRL S-495]
MLKFDTPAPVTAAVDLPAASVRFVAADRGDTTVEVLPADASESHDVLAAERVRVTCADGLLRITAPEAPHRDLGDPGRIRVTVRLPSGSRVQVRAALGELRGVGRLGEVTFEGERGTVDLEESVGAHLTVRSGDIHLGRLSGPARITTRKGDLTVAEATGGATDLRTGHGDITVAAARGTCATLKATTSYGRILNTLSNTQDTAARLALTATTTFGDIAARSL